MIDSESSTLDLIAGFVQAAETARQVEDAYRKEAAARIATLAGARATAFRRLNLVRSAATAISEAAEPEKAVARARFVIAQTLGWEEPGPRQALVLDRLSPFLEALSASLTPGAAAADDNAADTGAAAALRRFEDWYRAETGSEFYALFERYMPETPRVDF